MSVAVFVGDPLRRTVHSPSSSLLVRSFLLTFGNETSTSNGSSYLFAP